MKYLVIVESPNKIKTLEDILKDEKDEFKVIATAGHILDLEKKNMGVDLRTFKPSYVEITAKKSIITNLKKTYNSFKPDIVLLAGDIDFEGTFINWSVKETLHLENPRTLEFIALTKDDVLKALKKETYINPHHLDAQQTRRILDRVCGFSITGELFKLYGGNISAGRVQSVVSKLIIDKEKEIEEWMKNDKKSFYNIKGIVDNEFNSVAKYGEVEFESVEDLDIFKGQYKIVKKSNKQNNIKPQKPFNTSTLQQKANTIFHFPSSLTMNVLQSLFTKGLITYHRTTSIVLSDECLDMCREYICNEYGEEYYEKRIYRDKSNNSENSHEAIRHTTNNPTPSGLNANEMKLYKLIFNTTIQSQMKDKIVNEMKVELSNGEIDDCFVVSVKKNVFKGWDMKEEDCKEYEWFEEKNVDDIINFKEIDFIERYDNPPARYSEATLINKLSPKNLNIGRPSTYASIIEKIIKRGYVEIKDIEGKEMKTKNYIMDKDGKIEEVESVFMIGSEEKKFKPTELGIKIVKFMNDNFSNIMDYHFTAELENKLDLIGEDKLKKNETLREFYKELKVGLDKTKEFIKENKKGNVVGMRDGKEIVLKGGRYGEYIEWNGEKINCKDVDCNIEDLNERYNNLIDKKKNVVEETYTYKRTKIVMKNGRYGKYFEYGGKKYSVKCEEVNNDVIKDIIEEGEKKIMKKVGRYEIINGPYGPYFKNGVKFIGVPKEYDIDKLTVDDIKLIIENDKAKPKKKFYRKKK